MVHSHSQRSNMVTFLLVALTASASAGPPSPSPSSTGVHSPGALPPILPRPVDVDSPGHLSLPNLTERLARRDDDPGKVQPPSLEPLQDCVPHPDSPYFRDPRHDLYRALVKLSLPDHKDLPRECDDHEARILHDRINKWSVPGMLALLGEEYAFDVKHNTWHPENYEVTGQLPPGAPPPSKRSPRNPLALKHPSGSAGSSGTPGPAVFNLRTHVVNGTEAHDGLYVTAWHTGAGTGDAVLLPQRPQNQVGRLAGAQLLYQLGSDPSAPPAYVNLPYQPYAAWAPVTIDQAIGPMPAGGFYFNNTAPDRLGKGLKFNFEYPQAPPPGNASQGWGGWYACDWWHQVPQLFWIVPNYGGNKNDVTAACSHVELLREGFNE